MSRSSSAGYGAASVCPRSSRSCRPAGIVADEATMAAVTREAASVDRRTLARARRRGGRRPPARRPRRRAHRRRGARATGAGRAQSRRRSPRDAALAARRSLSSGASSCSCCSPGPSSPGSSASARRPSPSWPPSCSTPRSASPPSGARGSRWPGCARSRCRTRSCAGAAQWCRSRAPSWCPAISSCSRRACGCPPTPASSGAPPSA